MLIFTLLARTTASLKNVADILKDTLGEVVEGVEENKDRNEYNYTLQDGSILTLTIPEHVNTREKLTSQLNAIGNYYNAIETEHEQIKEALVAQIGLWNTMMTITFVNTGDESRLNYLYLCAIRAAKTISGYLMLPELSILNGDGKLVFSPDGNTQVEELHPIAAADSVVQHESEPTEADLARYKKSVEIIKAQGLECMENIKLALQESEFNLRSKKEVVKRAIALFAVGVFSECRLNKEYTLQDAREQITLLDDQFGVTKYFTPNEAAYLKDKNFDQQTSVQFIWRYECSALLMWSIGLIKEISGVGALSCNVGELADTIRKFKNFEHVVVAANMRSKEELLQMQDLMMRYKWICLQHQIDNKPMPEALTPGIVVERHRALNWLVTEFFGKDWDNIETPA